MTPVLTIPCMLDKDDVVWSCISSTSMAIREVFSESTFYPSYFYASNLRLGNLRNVEKCNTGNGLVENLENRRTIPIEMHGLSPCIRCPKEADRLFDGKRMATADWKHHCSGHALLTCWICVVLIRSSPSQIYMVFCQSEKGEKGSRPMQWWQGISSDFCLLFLFRHVTSLMYL